MTSNAITIEEVITNLHIFRNAARDLARKARVDKDIPGFKYWMGRYDATSEAFDLVMSL